MIASAGGITLCGDCANVVAVASMHPRKQHSHKRVHAGAHRLAAKASRGDRVLSDVKVKAHLTVTADMDCVTVRHIRGNEKADEHAKAAHELQPQFLRGDAATRTRSVRTASTMTCVRYAVP